MKKVFVGSIPLQKPQQRHYTAQDNSRLHYDKVTSHPLVLLMNGYIQAGDQVAVIFCVTESPVADDNAAALQLELESLRNERDFDLSITIKKFPDDEHLDAHINLFTDLLSCFDQNDQLYMDITFGTKPTPIIFLNLAYFLNMTRDVSVECVCYGRIPNHHDLDRPGLVYDVTSLYRLTTTIDILAKMKVENPEAVIKKLLSAQEK